MRFYDLPFYALSWVLANRVRRALGRRARPKACCRQPENLSDPRRMAADRLIRVCAVCGCRHFEQTLDAGQLGVRIAG